MSERAVIVHPDGDAVAVATAHRLLLAILDAQAVRRPVHVCLTGGTVGTKTLVQVAASPLRDLVDWTGVHLWWGDERFVASDSPDRNALQAQEAMIGQLTIPSGNVHPFPSTEGGTDLGPAADAYAAELAAHAADGARWPIFDVTLLGMGPDGHVASLFPGKPTLTVADRAVVAEPDSPKPPPQRLSLTVPVLNSSRQVWFVVAGADKHDAAQQVLYGDSDLPAALVSGQDTTLWLLDTAAAGA